MMVDGFEPLSDVGADPCVSPTRATTTLAVERNNYFIIGGNELSESGIIEHQAQSVSALAGYKDLVGNASKRCDHEEAATLGSVAHYSPPVGIIGEVKHFECLRRPKVGERLVTTVQMGMTFGNVTLANCETAIDQEVVARINIKVFMQ
jgi:hypothetical protein